MMFASFLLSLREGLEAALIIGIVLGVLVKLKRTDLNGVVWRGVGLAALLSLLAAIALNLLGMEFEGKGEEIFEGVAMLLAAGVLTWMILWMQNHGGTLKSEIEEQTNQATLEKGQKALFALAFLAVFREGIELALFLLAARLTSSPLQTISGALLGLSGAAVLGWILFTSTMRLSLRNFFGATNILLVIFAAGLVGVGRIAGRGAAALRHAAARRAVRRTRRGAGRGLALAALFLVDQLQQIVRGLLHVGVVVLRGALFGRDDA